MKGGGSLFENARQPPAAGSDIFSPLGERD